jgi:hypothetical protein
LAAANQGRWVFPQIGSGEPKLPKLLWPNQFPRNLEQSRVSSGHLSVRPQELVRPGRNGLPDPSQTPRHLDPVDGEHPADRSVLAPEGPVAGELERLDAVLCEPVQGGVETIEGEALVGAGLPREQGVGSGAIAPVHVMRDSFVEHDASDVGDIRILSRIDQSTPTWQFGLQVSHRCVEHLVGQHVFQVVDPFLRRASVRKHFGEVDEDDRLPGKLGTGLYATAEEIAGEVIRVEGHRVEHRLARDDEPDRRRTQPPTLGKVASHLRGDSLPQRDFARVQLSHHRVDGLLVLVRRTDVEAAHPRVGEFERTRDLSLRAGAEELLHVPARGSIGARPRDARGFGAALAVPVSRRVLPKREHLSRGRGVENDVLGSDSSRASASGGARHRRLRGVAHADPDPNRRDRIGDAQQGQEEPENAQVRTPRRGAG